ncbi:MAG: hypothetical protein LW817_01420 [Candidatus Caenarcaniphilales bacterium]|nr:hypothetical protein [Candidatus Caenarcaniphilales bacterium]
MPEINYFHKGLAGGRWFEFPLALQLGNIGGEIQRHINAMKREDPQAAQDAFYKAIELIDLTKNDPKHRGTGRLKEICRLKEFLVDAIFNDPPLYKSDLEGLVKYCNQMVISYKSQH